MLCHGKFAFLGIALTVLTNQAFVMSFTSDPIVACVGQLDKKLLFITFDLNVFEYDLNTISPDGALLDRNVSTVLLQNKWSSLYPILMDVSNLQHMLTVRQSDSKNTTYLLWVTKSKGSIRVFTFYDLVKQNKTLSKKMTLNGPELMDGKNVWISSPDAGQFYLLQTGPYYSLAKYEFSNKANLPNSEGLNIFDFNFNLCKDGTYLKLAIGNCFDSFTHVQHTEWNIRIGFAIEDRIYLINGTQIFSIDLIALALSDIASDPLVSSQFEFLDELPTTRQRFITISNKLMYFPTYILVFVTITISLTFGAYTLFLVRTGVSCFCMFFWCHPGITREMWIDPFRFWDAEAQARKDEEEQLSLVATSKSKLPSPKVNSKQPDNMLRTKALVANGKVSKELIVKKIKPSQAPPVSPGYANNCNKASSVAVSHGNLKLNGKTSSLVLSDSSKNRCKNSTSWPKVQSTPKEAANLMTPASNSKTNFPDGIFKPKVLLAQANVDSKCSILAKKI